MRGIVQAFCYFIQNQACVWYDFLFEKYVFILDEIYVSSLYMVAWS